MSEFVNINLREPLQAGLRGLFFINWLVGAGFKGVPLNPHTASLCSRTVKGIMIQWPSPGTPQNTGSLYTEIKSDTKEERFIFSYCIQIVPLD